MAERPGAETNAEEGVLPGFLAAICPWASGDIAVSTHFPYCLTQHDLIACNQGLNLVSTKVFTEAKREPEPSVTLLVFFFSSTARSHKGSWSAL